MTSRKRRGPAKDIENLCVEVCSGLITETKFKEGFGEICRRGMPYLYIGEALQRSATEYCKGKENYLWQLADEVEPKIKQAFERYKEIFFQRETRR